MRVHGAFANADNYILRNTPAVGAGKRVQARVFRVRAYTHLIEKEAARRIEGVAAEDAPRIVAAYQAEIDQWLLAEHRGELVFDLAIDGKERRGRPLEGALVNGPRWNTAAFSSGWNEPDAIECPGCGATAANSGDGYCMSCAEDDAGANVALPANKVLGAIEGVEWPASVKRALDFGERKLLGYLAVSDLAADVDLQDTFVHGTLVVGAWDTVLRLALELRGKVEGDFAAALVTASPHAGMRRSAEAARCELARAGANQFALFHEILDWKRAAEVAERGFEMAGWLKEDRIDGTDSRRRIIRRIADLHRMSRESSEGGKLRYLPLLIWETREADKVLRRRMLRLAADRAQWENIGLVTELALLAGRE